MSVDFLIVTPVQMDVDLKSVNGSVEVVKLRGYAALRTVNGKIRADDIEGSVDKKTTNSGIYIEISKLVERREMSFYSVNGGI